MSDLSYKVPVQTGFTVRERDMGAKQDFSMTDAIFRCWWMSIGINSDHIFSINIFTICLNDFKDGHILISKIPSLSGKFGEEISYWTFYQLRVTNTDISYVYHFIDSRRGRELIFQDHSYIRFGTSNIFNCSSKKSKQCNAQVMLDVNKVLIISTNHNHLPPFLVRDKNGTLVYSYMLRARPKNRKKIKPLGPLASHNEVNSLVASILHSAKEMENRAEYAANNANIPPEIETRDSVLNDVTPENNENSSEATENINVTIETEIRASVSYEETSEKNETSSLKINNETSYKNESGSSMSKNMKKMAPVSSLMSPGKNHIARREVDSVQLTQEFLVPPEGNSMPIIKQKKGLVTNQMYIVLPNSEASMVSHNRMIISPQQNKGGLLNKNKILVSPVSTETSPIVTSNFQSMQPKKNDTVAVPSAIVSNKVDGNKVVNNKMFLVLHSNNAVSAQSKKNETGALVQSTNENVTPKNEIAANKMFILVHNINENDSNAHSQSNIIQPKKVELKTSIPISSIKNIILSKKSDTNRLIMNEITLSNIAESRNVETSKIQPIALGKNETMASVTSIINVQPTVFETGCAVTRPVHSPSKFETLDVVSSSMQPIVPRKTETVSVISNKVQRTGSTARSSKTIPTGPQKTENDISVSSQIDLFQTKKIETVTIAPNIIDSTESSKTILFPKKIDIDSAESSKMQLVAAMETESDGVGSNKMQSIKPQKTVSSVASDIDMSLNEINTDWIIPKNKQTVQTKKIKSHVTSTKDTKQPMAHETGFKCMARVPITVSMIPLPRDNDLVYDTNTKPTASTANETVSVIEGVPPWVMIERLKDKAGPSMYGVPPKKRHYQP